MKKTDKKADIYSIEYYLPNQFKLSPHARFSEAFLKTKSFKILVQDDVKDSLYLIDA
jgi:hypothetical protein